MELHHLAEYRSAKLRVYFLTSPMSAFEPEETEPLDIAVKLFPPFKVDEAAPPSTGRPDDYPGFECLAVLHTVGGPFRAGKSYRPDPSGSRNAVKVNDCTVGTTFLCNTVWFDCLEHVL
jgi:hypothetical protein